MARRTTLLRGEGSACVSCYEIDEKELGKLKTLRFDKADRAWLDFVAANRSGTAQPNDWSVIIGPVANDQTFPTILLYLDGYLDAESTIRNLLTQRLKDQYAFKTAEAIALLRFVEMKTV